MTLLSLDRPSRSLFARASARVVITALLAGMTPVPPPAAASIAVPRLPSFLPMAPEASLDAPSTATPARAARPAPARATRAPHRVAAAAVPAAQVRPSDAPRSVEKPRPAPASAPRGEAPSAERDNAPQEELVSRSHTFPAGWNLMSVPLVPTDPSPQGVFADVPAPLYLYDYVAGFTLAPGEPGFRNAVPGRVYWLLLRAATTIEVDGDPLPLVEYRKAIVPGWNSVGDPWLAPVTWDNSRVSIQNGSTTLGLAEAIGQGWVEGNLRGHDPASDASTTVTPGGALQPWKGYYLFSNVTADLIFSSPGQDNVPPQVSFANGTDGRSIVEPTEIAGSVSDDNLVDWRLEFAAAGTNDFVQIGHGEANVAGGVLGTLDPTMLTNGVYIIRLTATDMANTVSTLEAGVVVRENQKVGNFSVSFVDLEVPVAGMPIRVTRTYDSRDTRRGDFGYGWRLDLSNVKIGLSVTPGLSWYATQAGHPIVNYCLQPTRAHIVTLTFPDGKVYEFEPALSRECQLTTPPTTQTISFQPRPGTLGSLEALGPPEAEVLFQTWDGPVQLVHPNSSNFDPPGYRLTLPDGRQFVVTKASGLQSITDRNGNQLTVGPNGIVHSSGKGIAFVRNGVGQITSIIDPMGHELVYGYYPNGDLETFTDREENTTSFTYYPGIPHFLWEIKDPLGRTPIRNEYNDEGRLISHTDAYGKTITYTHNVAGRDEIVTDRIGGVRRLIYDQRGNVLEETDPEGKVTTRTYDDRNNRLTETDPNDHTTTYTYDGDYLLTVKDPEDNLTEYTYNDFGEVLTVKDARGKVTTNVYDADSDPDLDTTTDAMGNITRYTHDGQGNVLTRTVTVDGVDLVTTYTYDDFGGMLTEKDALNHITTYTYDLNGNRLTEARTRTLPGGGTQTLTTIHEYDLNGRLKKTTDPDNTFTRTVYDELGRPKESYDKLNRMTSYEYDDMGRLLKTTYPDTTFESSTYDDEGRRLTSRDRGGRVTGYIHDGVGRLKRTTFPDGFYTENTYDDAGRLITVRDPRGKFTTYGYDDAGRRTLVRDPLAHETTFGYDPNGNQQSILDARGHTTTFEYDDLNRRTRTIFHDTTFTLTGYDAIGRRRSEIDQDGKLTLFGYDAVGRLLSVTDALNKVTTYAYDQVGNRITQTDANIPARVTRFEYDELGRETKRILPGGAFETKDYDDAGNLTTRVDFMGRTILHGHDPNNSRLTSITYPTGPATGFTYTPTGRRLTATDARGTTGYVHDLRDRLERITYPDGRRLDYGYDPASNRTSLSATIGTSTLITGYGYDDDGRLETVTDPQARVYTHGYDPVHNRSSLAYPNGTTTSYTYNTLNRLTNLTTANPVVGIVQGYTFTLGLSGNRTRIDEADGSARVYTYDDVYRLLTDNVTGAVVYDKTFTYDNVGNRLTQITNGQGAGSVSYTYDDRDRLITEAGASLDYDNNGNLTSRTADGSDYTWDFENRLVGITKPDGTVLAHVYDVDGVRVQTTTTLPGQPPVAVNFLVDTSGSLSHVVAETDVAGGVLAYYVRGDDLLAVIRGSGTKFMHADGIGSIRRLTDESGAVTDSYAYTAFGELLGHTGSDPQPYAFAGEPLDPNSGFQYHRARWMDPRVGRFTGMDPFEGIAVRPTTLHRYGYAGGNAVNNVDPSGELFDSNSALTTVYSSTTIRATSSITFGKMLTAFALAGVAGGQIFGPLAALREIKERGVPTDLYAFGNRTAPRGPRPSDFNLPNDSGMVGPETPPLPKGASTFGDPSAAPLTGHYHRIPRGILVPPGLAVTADGPEVQGSPHPATHHTIYPVVAMPFQRFVQKFFELPWEYADKK